MKNAKKTYKTRPRRSERPTEELRDLPQGERERLVRQNRMKGRRLGVKEPESSD